MNIVFFSHPCFVQIQSIPRYVKMLSEGMRERGHTVEIISPAPKLFRIPLQKPLRKWLGYFDQFVLFPIMIRKRIKKYSGDTLFVIPDQALGPWIPMISHRPHVVHCHDFLAQLSAKGEIIENPTSWSGKKYQAFIRKGYRNGKNFISVSEKTRKDLHRFLPCKPLSSDMVYNGLNQTFIPENIYGVRKELSQKLKIDLSNGYLLHVGGNQWYKNRKGVIEIYDAWRKMYENGLPLLFIGEDPSDSLRERYEVSLYGRDIHFLTNMEDNLLRISYAGAAILLFPSLAEGFGWPIVEAMASGCPVITTNQEPMLEVAGNAGFFIPRFPMDRLSVENWAKQAATVVESVLKLSPNDHQEAIQKGFVNVTRFNTIDILNRIENIYENILNKYWSV